MRASQCLTCTALACVDVDRRSFVVPGIDVRPEAVSIVMVSEAAPGDPGDYYYAGEGSLFERTTVEAFRDAGTNVRSIRDLVDMGVYFTTAVKCGRPGMGSRPTRSGRARCCSNGSWRSSRAHAC